MLLLETLACGFIHMMLGLSTALGAISGDLMTSGRECVPQGTDLQIPAVRAIVHVWVYMSARSILHMAGTRQ